MYRYQKRPVNTFKGLQAAYVYLIDGFFKDGQGHRYETLQLNAVVLIALIEADIGC